ncbi:MAG: hypothetical protein ACLT5P_05460 [Flavonifractor plautii]
MKTTTLAVLLASATCSAAVDPHFFHRRIASETVSQVSNDHDDVSGPTADWPSAGSKACLF